MFSNLKAGDKGSVRSCIYLLAGARLYLFMKILALHQTLLFDSKNDETQMRQILIRQTIGLHANFCI